MKNVRLSIASAVVFSSPTVFKDMKTLALFEGRLAAPFGLAGTNGDFAAAGVAGGGLHIHSVSSNRFNETNYQSQKKGGKRGR